MAQRGVIPSFFVGEGGRQLTPQHVAELNRRSQQSWDHGNPAFQNAGWLGALGSGLEGLHSAVLRRRADRADEAGREGARTMVESNPVLSALGAVPDDPWVREVYGVGLRDLFEQGGRPSTSAPSPEVRSALGDPQPDSSTYPQDIGSVSAHGAQGAFPGEETLADKLTARDLEKRDTSPRGRDAFGVAGAFRGAVNRASDSFGFGNVFEDAAEASTYFNELGVRLLQAYGGGFERQPPSWLLRTVEDLLPQASSVWEGPESARLKLETVRSTIEDQMNTALRLLELDNTTAQNTALHRQIYEHENALQIIDDGLGMLGAESTGGLRDAAGQAYGALTGSDATGPEAPEVGTVMDGWRFMGGDPADPASWERVP